MQTLFSKTFLKSYRFWLAAIVLSYTLCGFLLVPYVVKTQLVNYVQDSLEQEAQLEAVSFNPFLLRLRLHNLNIETKDHAPLLSTGELFVDFDSFGIFKRAWQFTTISLTDPDVFVEIDSEGALNLNKLIPPSSDTDETNDTDAEPGALPRLILQDISINNARIRYHQLNRSEPFQRDLSPLNFKLANFSTLPEDGGHYRFEAQITETETIGFSGTLQIQPLAVAGKISLSQIELSHASDYLQDLLKFKVVDGTLSVDTDFTLQQLGPEQELSLRAENLLVTIEQLRLDTDTPEPLLSLPRIALSGGSLAWPEQAIQIKTISIEQGTVHSWLTADKVFNYTQLINNPASSETASTDEPKTESRPWQVNLDEFRIENLLLNFDDRSLSELTRQAVNIASLSLKSFNLEQGSEFDLDSYLTMNETGNATISGKISAFPAAAALEIAMRDLPLHPLENYLHDNIQLNLVDGNVDADLEINYAKRHGNSFDLAGDIEINQLTTFDIVDQENWVAWQQLSLQAVELSLEPERLDIANIVLTKPYFDVVIFDNGESRINRMLKSTANQESSDITEKETSDQSPPTKPASPDSETDFPVNIAKFKLIDGTMDFKDFNLPLNFATHIHSLHGEAHNLSTTSNEHAKITLDGKVDRYGTAKINAETILKSPQEFSDITLNFAHIDITSASSYSGKFAGYAIEAGTLSLDLGYRIENTQMQGTNRILLEQLTLGEPVESPDAVSLPLKFAVALMKDIDGNIDIDLPVEGDLSNPEVRIAGVVWKALTNLIVKIVASPFAALGSLFGEDSSGLDTVVFTAGSSELSTAVQENLDKLTKGLLQKPELALTINACYNTEADTLALQTEQFNSAYRLLSGESSKGTEDASPLALNYQTEFLETLYEETFGSEQLDKLKTQSKQVFAQESTDTTQNPEDLAHRTRELIDQKMLQQLINQQPLAPQALATLASQRATATFKYLTVSTGSDQRLTESRIQINQLAEPVDVTPEGINCPLTLSAL